jgi:hypothetical protein
MQCEMYIAQLVKHFEKSQDIVSQYFQRFNRVSLMEQIADKNTPIRLSREFGSQKEEVFKKLANEVRDAFRHIPRIRFTREHLRALLSDEGEMRLATLLGVEQKPLNTLFHRERVYQSFSKACTYQLPPDRDVEDILSYAGFLNGAVGSLEACLGLGPNDWGQIIRRERWLTDFAKRTITTAVACEEKEIPSVLAQVMENQLSSSRGLLEDIGSIEDKFKLSLDGITRIDDDPTYPLGVPEDEREQPVWEMSSPETRRVEDVEQPSYYDSLALKFLKARLQHIAEEFFEESRLSNN